jgi:hypothetical protein
MANTYINELRYPILGDGVSLTAVIPLGFNPTSVTFVSASDNVNGDVSANVSSVVLSYGDVVTVTFIAPFTTEVVIVLNVLLDTLRVTFTEKSVGTAFSVNTGATPVLVNSGVRHPLLSIQPELGLSPPTSSLFTLFKYRLAGNGATALFELVLNGTLTGASFQPVGSPSNMNFSTSATAVSGGRVLDSGYLTLGGLESDTLSFGFNFTDLFIGDIFTLVVTPMGSKPNLLSASFNWVEGGN